MIGPLIQVDIFESAPLQFAKPKPTVESLRREIAEEAKRLRQLELLESKSTPTRRHAGSASRPSGGGSRNPRPKADTFTNAHFREWLGMPSKTATERQLTAFENWIQTP